MDNLQDPCGVGAVRKLRDVVSGKGKYVLTRASC